MIKVIKAMPRKVSRREELALVEINNSKGRLHMIFMGLIVVVFLAVALYKVIN